MYANTSYVIICSYSIREGFYCHYKQYGDRGQPCRTPLLMGRHINICPLFSTAAHISLYSVFTYDLNFKQKLKFSKHLSTYDHFKQSNAFSKPVESMIPFKLFCLL